MNLRLHIRKVLNEDYEAINEIIDLSNDCLIFLAKTNFKSLSKTPVEEISRFSPIRLIDVYQENPKKYSKLASFIINARLSIYPTPAKDSDFATKGSYTKINEPEYNNERYRSIYLYYDNNLINSIKEKFEGANKEIFEYKDIYFTFWYAFASVLSHELQHAYDDYRSNSKALSTKQGKKFLDKYHDSTGKELAIDDLKKRFDKHIEYLKLPHEVWTRFTQAVQRIHFYSADFKKNENGRTYFEYEMKPITEVAKELKYEFNEWGVLSEPIKRKLVRKVAQFWHKKSEDLKVKNAKQLEKLKRPEPEEELAEGKEKKKTLKDILNSDEAYAIIDSTKASGSGWVDGGCAILAVALNKVFGYEVYAIYDNGLNQVDHFVGKTPRGTFVDYNGEQKQIVNNFKRREMLQHKNLSLLKYEPGMSTSDIVFDDKASNDLANLIKNNFKK